MGEEKGIDKGGEDEQKKTRVTWGVMDGVKFGFGFGFGMFLWGIAFVIALLGILSLLLPGRTF